jgi:hypothetical protein
MADEPEEVIKHQMQETRASLTEKLETLEQQVVGTVHNATSAVTDTVACVKEAVQDTVEAVKDTFDLPRQVRQHPWIMLGGSIALGYTGGCLLKRLESNGRREETGAPLNGPAFSVHSARGRDGGVSARMEEASRTATTASATPGLLDELGQKFQSELHQLKGLALGTMLGVVRDMVARAAPPQVSSQLADIIDSATVKLGGQPIHGPVMSMFEHDAVGKSESPWQGPGRTERTGRDASSGDLY